MYLSESSKRAKDCKAGKRINSFYVPKEQESEKRYKSGRKKNSFYIETEQKEKLYELQNVEDANEIFFSDNKAKEIKSECTNILE